MRRGGDLLVRIEKSIGITAPPEKVWELFAFDMLPEWMEEIKGGEYTSGVSTPEDKYEVGATAHLLDKHGGSKYACEITEKIENQKISSRWQGTGWARNMTVTHTLKATESGSEMRFAVDYEEPNLIIRMILRLLVYLAGEKEIERSLRRLKRTLEE